VYLKIVRQHGGVARKASDAAIGVLKNYDVELPAPSRNLSSNLTDSPEETQLLQQPRRDSTTYITDHDGLARFDSKYMSRIHTHISAPDDYCFHIGHRPRKRGHQRNRSLLCNKISVTFQHAIETVHADPP
jgi:hypothetical protein